MIGRAAVRRLLEHGWDVTVASRGERELPDELGDVRRVEVDRDDAASVRDILGPGADVLVDIVAYDADDAEQLLALAGLVGSVVAISSASVYADDAGHTLDEATGPADFPAFPVPIAETQRTVEPGRETYSRRKAALERALLEQDRLPATVVRPCAIYGPGDTQAREWFFVKRALDGRPFVVLAYGGASVFHTTASENLAELICLAAARPDTRVLNCGDPDPPTVLEIARSVSRVRRHEWAEVLLPAAPRSIAVGATPWSTPTPLVVDMSAAERELGYRPVVTYGEWVERTCEWMVEATRGRDWREVLPAAAAYFGDRFDYAAEEAFLVDLAR